MEEGGEPPDRGQGKYRDTKRILLNPNPKLEELAVCNPSVCDNHFVYRAREKSNNGYGERSVVKYQRLVNPYELSGNPRTILLPEHEWEKDGTEDARISSNGLYHIVYVAFNEDRGNGGARIALANTEDFKTIQKEGIIGSPIRLEEGIQLAGGPDSYYGERFQKTLKGIREDHPGINPYIEDKDATIVYNIYGKPMLLHRMGDSIQATPFSEIADLKNEDFWRWKMGELEKDTILYPGKRWAPEKVGLGGTPVNIDGRIIGHIHGVKKTDRENRTTYVYNSTFAEFDPETYHIVSILRDPILTPDKKFVLIEQDGEKVVKKYVNFATGMAIDPNNPSIICNYSGVGDYGIELRTTNLKKWLLNELSHPHNRVENWKRVTQITEH